MNYGALMNVLNFPTFGNNKITTFDFQFLSI